MSSPIGFREFSEDDYRKFIRTLSDEELIKAGKRLRILCGDVVTPNLSTIRHTGLKSTARVNADIAVTTPENKLIYSELAKIETSRLEEDVSDQPASDRIAA